MPHFLEPTKMEYFLRKYIGQHDFHNFIKVTKENRDKATVGSLDNVEISYSQDEVSGTQSYQLRFVGQRFMTYQIRHMVNYAVKGVLGFYTEDEFMRLLNTKQDLARVKGRNPAPGKGLWLEKVIWDSRKVEKWLTADEFLEIAGRLVECKNGCAGFSEADRLGLEKFERDFLWESDLPLGANDCL
jgi:tRNA U38,U39,U40 pseudouridine synthase TruA